MLVDPFQKIEIGEKEGKEEEKKGEKERKRRERREKERGTVKADSAKILGTHRKHTQVTYCP